MSPLYVVADRLLKWSVTSQIGAKDVMADEASGIVAFVGPALSFERGVLKNPINNHDFYLNKSFGDLFGIPVTTEHWENSYRVRSTKPMWFHDSDGEVLSQFLEQMDSALRDGMEALTGQTSEDGAIQCTIITEPGYVWTPKTTEVYSARKKKVLKVERPPWAVQIKDREGKLQWAVDFCKLMPVICPSGGQALVGRFRQHDDLGYLVTHCSPLASGGKITQAQPERYARLQACPGMLFPSLAVGAIPATNFGETVLVVRPDAILGSMRPYRERGQWAVTVFSTDTWTEGAGALVEEIAITAFKQLHGHENWMYSDHAYVLGPSIPETGFADEPVAPITSTAKLATTLKRRFTKWYRELPPKSFAKLSNVMTGERYGYLEAKVNAVLGWGCIPLAVTPRQFGPKVDPALRRMGFTGTLLAVDVPDEIAASFMDDYKYDGWEKFAASLGDMAQEIGSGARTLFQSYQAYQYAWLARDAIMEYIQQRNGSAIFPVEEA